MVFLHGLLPRDASPQSVRRRKISDVNNLLEGLCGWQRMTYIKPCSDFCEINGYLSGIHYYIDNLHLSRVGNETLARTIVSAVKRKKERSNNQAPSYNYAIFQTEFLGDRWDSYALGQFESIGATPSHPSSHLPASLPPPGDGFPPLSPAPMQRISSSPVTPS